MKPPLSYCRLAALAAPMLFGCGHVDFTPAGAGNPNRVLIGTVQAPDSETLPPDTVVAVEVVDPERATEKPPSAVLGEPATAPLQSTLPPKVLGEQVIRSPGQFPVAFRIEYTAVDEQLERGLILQARVSYGGKVRYFNVNSSAVTLGNYAEPHSIFVNRL
jgi:uncharacterized lipoprotein YbaY